jgi:hypothetical protein
MKACQCLANHHWLLLQCPPPRSSCSPLMLKNQNYIILYCFFIMLLSVIFKSENNKCYAIT